MSKPLKCSGCKKHIWKYEATKIGRKTFCRKCIRKINKEKDLH